MKRRNPDDFTLLHRIRFKVRQYKVGFSIEVYDGPQQIARGKFFKGPWTAGPWEKEKVVEAVIIEVEKPWQRKGVASAIYRKVEELGYTIHPSSSQTHYGVKLWRGGRWGKRDEIVNSGILSRWKTEYARANPDDKDRLAKMKFAARLFRESRGGKACDVTAKLGGSIIGRAVFHGYSSGGENSISEASGIWVHPEHRRIGVASRMVTLAEETMGARWSGRAISEDGANFIKGRRVNPSSKTSKLYRGLILSPDVQNRSTGVDVRSDSDIVARVKKTYRKGGLYGAHWTSEKAVAFDFAVGEAEKANWWDINDPTSRVIGVIIEVAQRGENVELEGGMFDLDDNQPGEFGVKPPREKDVLSVKFHLVAMEPGPYPRNRTRIRTIEAS